MEYLKSTLYHDRIMAIVFSQMFRSTTIPNYPVYLMSGQVLFNYMNISTHGAINSINGSASLLKKTYLPKYVFTVSKITSGLIDCIFSIGAFDRNAVHRSNFFMAFTFIPIDPDSAVCILCWTGNVFSWQRMYFSC